MWRSFTEFADASLTNGALYAIQKFRDKRTDMHVSCFTESEVNELGYRFLNELNRLEDALEIFKFNITLHPQSANTYDSLGEAYFIAGDVPSAAENYKKSLSLDPFNKNAQQMLRQLKILH